MKHRLTAFLCMLVLLIPSFPAALAAGEEALPEAEIVPPIVRVPEYVEEILEIARGELGYTEDQYKNTKYGIWAGDPDAEWCAEFLCWCVYEADRTKGTDLLKKRYPKYSGTNTGRNWFIQEGRYIARTGNVPEWGSQWMRGSEEKIAKNSYVPQPGDWVFFSVYASGDTSHVAMVEYCTRDEQGNVTVHVIEGNNPDRVQRNAYAIDYWAIQGYGTVSDFADFTMRSGCEGRKVNELQEKLSLLGYLEAQYVTGKYALITAKAVSAFQKDHGLPESGIATQATQLCLNEEYRLFCEARENADLLWAVDED